MADEEDSDEQSLVEENPPFNSECLKAALVTNLSAAMMMAEVLGYIWICVDMVESYSTIGKLCAVLIGVCAVFLIICWFGILWYLIQIFNDNGTKFGGAVVLTILYEVLVLLIAILLMVVYILHRDKSTSLEFIIAWTIFAIVDSIFNSGRMRLFIIKTRRDVEDSPIDDV